MWRIRILLILLLVFAVLNGCAANQQMEILEARLRAQETELARTQSELERSEYELSIARQESNALRTQLTGGGHSVMTPEQANVLYRLSAIQVDPLQTSFLPSGNSGTGTINLLISPLDQYQVALRIPGEIQVRIFAGKQAAGEALISETFPAKLVSESWTSGWVSSGFLLQLPWNPSTLSQPLTSNQVFVQVEFVTADQRKFSTDYLLNLAAGAQTQENPSPIPIVIPPEPSKILPPNAPPSVPLAQTPPLPASPEPKIQTARFNEFQPEPTDRIETSDRRTLEEMPVYR